jgi:cell division protein FtsB
MNTLVNQRNAVREKIGNAVALFVLVLIALLALIGPSGVLAWSDHAGQLEEYESRIGQLEEERAVLQNRVDLLDPDNVDPDLASELVRRDLNVAHEDEFVVELESLP